MLSEKETRERCKCQRMHEIVPFSLNKLNL